MKQEDLNKMNRLCDEFNMVYEKVSATFDMLYQFQNNKTEISESSTAGSALIMEDVIESLGNLKSSFFLFNKELRD